MLLEFIGKELIVETTRSVLGHLTDLEDHEDLYVNNIIEGLDINSKIKVISSIITRKENTTIPVKICIKNLSDIICKIKHELEEIKRLLPLHKEKWFHSWREGEYYKNLNKLKKLDVILDKRLQLFLQVCR